MRRRPSSRLLVVDESGRVLLFRFVHRSGPLAGQKFWATPGGGVEDGETFEQAALRELTEETGVVRETVGEPVAYREVEFQLPDGEWVSAQENYFLVWLDNTALARSGWSAEEAEVIADHHWWSKQELAQTADTVWPEDLLDMLNAASR
jgi:8-oxo-dGTP pyrophosphatase MutT (NUDIX family)